MPLYLLLVGAVLQLLAIFVSADDSKLMPGLNIRAQKAAINAWIERISDDDLDASKWVDITKSNQPQNYFEHYAKILSDIFAEQQAVVNFALVGACDGTNDRTIRDRYLPNEHWRGVFVEPFTMNYNDLSKFMHDHGVSHRTHLIHGAATNQCNATTIKMKRPTFEEKNSSLPHWMRRQIGAVVPWGKLDRPMTGGWVSEFTRCVTGKDILADWAGDVNRRSDSTDGVETADADAGGDRLRRQLVVSAVTPAAVSLSKYNSAHSVDSRQLQSGGGKRSRGSQMKRVRLHVLKVDVEGHDYEVLSSFLNDDFNNPQLPLLISFEAKSIKGRYTDLRAQMLARGYVVSHFANDGFAMLRTDKIYPKRGRNRSKSGDTDKETEGGVPEEGDEQEGVTDVAEMDGSEENEAEGGSSKRSPGAGKRRGRRRRKKGPKSGAKR